MKPIALLLLASCGAAPVDAGPPNPDCVPPAFEIPPCINPGGGVIRCAKADGSSWDLQPTGKMIHWRPASGSYYINICTLEAP